ncbi:MAG: hypothetical protein HY037_02470 [Nitrospirae bacterium]|nr:hypothetical protein [Candidatus Troglogloeales bacterium]
MLFISFVTGCAYFAVSFAHKKFPSTTRHPVAEQADDLFWKLPTRGTRKTELERESPDVDTDQNP